MLCVCVCVDVCVFPLFDFHSPVTELLKPGEDVPIINCCLRNHGVNVMRCIHHIEGTDVLVLHLGDGQDERGSIIGTRTFISFCLSLIILGILL